MRRAPHPFLRQSSHASSLATNRSSANTVSPYSLFTYPAAQAAALTYLLLFTFCSFMALQHGHDGCTRRLVQITAASIAMLSAVSLHAAVSEHAYCPRVYIKPHDLRKNWSFEGANRMFNDFEFGRAYRMGRRTFRMLLFLASSRLQKDVAMARRAGREVVSPEARLGILLRLMAGETVYGCMSSFEVGRSTVYQVFRESRETLNDILDLSGLPESFAGLKALSDSFQTSRSPPNPLPGCVGALDGIAIRIKKPSRDESPATFYCRKGYYAIPVQAVVDSNYRFLCFSAVCRGSTHDSLAHAVSSLGRYLEDGRLGEQFWIAGDEAYLCSESLITPIPASQASDVDDAFNFYHSSLRMHVEQAFGILVKKFRLLKMLEFSVNDSAATIALAMKLHNFCIDYGDKAQNRRPRSGAQVRQERSMIVESDEWYEDGKHYHFELVGRRRNMSSRKRGLLVDIIEEGRYVRPATAPIQVPSYVMNSKTRP